MGVVWSPARRVVVMVGRAPGSVGVVSLSGVDHEILVLLQVHRVLTTPQVIGLTGRPERTVDYRLGRLRSRGLVERTRPYVASGSAPFYWWLTRSGARLVEGSSTAPGKGVPNPLFLRHTAGIAGLYVALRRQGPTVGISLREWRRDERAWEDWSDACGPGRVRPDAYAELSLVVDGRTGVAGLLVEVDFATMDHARLRAKVGRYRRYVRSGVWWDRHPCCPALLLVTTSEARVERFLAVAERDRPRPSRIAADEPAGYVELVAACATVGSPETAVTGAVWRTAARGELTTLAGLLAPEVAKYRRLVFHAGAARQVDEHARRRSEAWGLSRHADAVAAAVGDPEAAAAVGYLLRRGGRGQPEWFDEHPDLAAATVDWWETAGRHATPASEGLAAGWRRAYRRCWLAQTGRLLAQHRAITLDDPLLRSPAAVLAAGGLVADYELDRPDPIDGRAAAATAMADHEARRAIAVTAALQALPLHRRLVASRADLEADYDTSHLCVCPRCATPANDDDPHAVWGPRCSCCAGPVVPAADAPDFPPPLEDSIGRIAARRQALRDRR